MKHSLLWLGLSCLPFMATAYDGNDLYQWSKGNQRVVAGTASGTQPMEAGMFMGFVLGVSSYLGASGTICFPEHAKNQQALDVVDNYLHMHPERRTDEAVLIVRDAMRAAFPCKEG